MPGTAATAGRRSRAAAHPAARGTRGPPAPAPTRPRAPTEPASASPGRTGRRMGRSDARSRSSGTELRRRGGGDRGREGTELVWVLAAGCELHAAGHVDRVRSHYRNRLGNVVGVQAATEDHGRGAAVNAGDLPRER